MKKIKIITIILLIILVTMISFLGIYTQVQNRMENQIKGYDLAMDLQGTRNIRLKVSTESQTIIKDENGNEVDDSTLTDEQIKEKGYTKEEVPYNAQEALTVDNYRLSKEIITERLNELNVNNYIIKQDEQNGDIIIELSEDVNTDNIISNLLTVGKFEIVDAQTQEVLLNNDDIKLSNVLYGASSSGTTQGTETYLNIEFTKEGAKKLEEISSTYVPADEDTTNTTEGNNTSTEGNTTNTTEESAANTTESENTTQNQESSSETENKDKEITMKIDGDEIMTTSFEEPIRTGKLQLSVGQTATDQESLNDNIQKASGMALVLDSGNTPLKYEIEGNEYILSDITDKQIEIAIYIVLAVVVIALLILIVRYKGLGALGVCSYIGLVSLFLLIIRYTNVVLSLEGCLGIILTLIINYILINNLLSKIKNKKDKEIKEISAEAFKTFFIKLIPICILIITFCFINWVPISSFGMVMFWGITLIAIYNLIITKNILILDQKK